MRSVNRVRKILARYLAKYLARAIYLILCVHIRARTNLRIFLRLRYNRKTTLRWRNFSNLYAATYNCHWTYLDRCEKYHVQGSNNKYFSLSMQHIVDHTASLSKYSTESKINVNRNVQTRNICTIFHCHFYLDNILRVYTVYM